MIRIFFLSQSSPILELFPFDKITLKSYICTVVTVMAKQCWSQRVLESGSWGHSVLQTPALVSYFSVFLMLRVLIRNITFNEYPHFCGEIRKNVNFVWLKIVLYPWVISSYKTRTFIFMQYVMFIFQKYLHGRAVSAPVFRS